MELSPSVLPPCSTSNYGTFLSALEKIVAQPCKIGMIYLTAIGWPPGGSSTVQYSTVVQYTCTHKQYGERHKTINIQKTLKLGRVRTVPCLCGFYPGICLTTEEKARKNLSQVKKNLSQCTVYILSKHQHITKPTQTHTLQNPHIHTHTLTHSHTHINTHSDITHTHPQMKSDFFFCYKIFQY